jgi:hypothetical protein
MIQLNNGEKIVKTFEVKKSTHGKGVFYITNYGIYFESQKHGMVIEVSFEWLRSYNVMKKNTFQIVWNTQTNERFSYEVKVDSAEEVRTVYRNANKEYAESMTEIQALKSKHTVSNSKRKTQQRQGVQRMIESHLQIESEKVDRRKEYLDRIIPRNAKRWNDCWYDEENKLYVVYNKFFTEQKEYHNTRTQLKWKEKYGDEAIIITEKNLDKTKKIVELIHGYPALYIGITKTNIPNLYILPTVTDKMLTKEMLKDRLHWADKAIDYTTESPRYHVDIQILDQVLTSLSFKESEFEDQLRGRETIQPGTLPDSDLNIMREYYTKQKECGFETITIAEYTLVK